MVVGLISEFPFLEPTWCYLGYSYSGLGTADSTVETRNCSTGEIGSSSISAVISEEQTASFGIMMGSGFNLGNVNESGHGSD